MEPVVDDKDWRGRVIAYIRAEAQPVDKYGHQPRLYGLVRTLATGMDVDDDVLFAAAWMHDVGVFTGHRPSDPEELALWNHVPYTVARTRALLADWNFPADKIDHVAALIETHQPHDEPATLEAVLLRDADILEQLGAVGAFRALAKVGRDSRYPTFSAVVSMLERLLKTLPGKLRTERAIELSRPRIAALEALLAAARSEAGEDLF